VTTVFVICAAFGGTILILQAVMTVVGFGGDALHTDVAHDFGHDFGGDAHADAGGLDSDTGADMHAEASAGSSDAHHGGSHGHGSSRLFAMLSFRGLVAAMAFFGLGGWTAQSAELPLQTVLLIAVACGGAAMYGMYSIMQWLASLHAEGTVQMDRAVGQAATVYLRIPGARSGAGKIQIDLQNRTMEYLAVTAGEPLPTGARVVVVGIVNPETVEVRPFSQSEGDGNE
jgi:hypothetical protein